MTGLDVSIVTATHNRAHLLPRAWASLRSQTPGFEWLVVDDGSTDNTAAVVGAFDDSRIQYVRMDRNYGAPHPARNRGARMARGRHLVFLDDDDELYPGSLAQMVAALDNADPSIGAAFFQVVLRNGRGWGETITDGAVYDEADLVCRRAPPAEKILVYRREVFDQYELPEDLFGGEGVFVYAVAKTYKFLMVDKPGRIYHFDPSSTSTGAKIIVNSGRIAQAFERILHNHAGVLRTCPSAERYYLIRALYRYAVAGARGDCVRLFRRVARTGHAGAIAYSSALLLMGLTGTGPAVERVRAPLRDRLSGWR